ncbi:MAG TPA: TerC family protein [Hyphomicrobiaceae bacterium]|jgi:YjbE family integral membrane protein|nr:TerC family protein [Hyphomicrobiaceae bacterium]
MIEWFELNLIPLLQIIVIDVVLAGDNAVVVGLAASRVAPEVRTRVIFWGMAGAVALRVAFAAVTVQLLAIVGLTLAGGILLLWVCWKMYRELVRSNGDNGHAGTGDTIKRMSFSAAVSQIILADVSMSLDNVLAVAGVAKESTLVLVIGLGVAIVLMAVAANLIAGLLGRYPWITWIGLLIIVYVALDMIYDGSREVACAAGGGRWCAPDLWGLLRALLTG